MSSLKILQVNASAAGGGAPRVVSQLHRAYRELGCRAWMAVGYPPANGTDILEIPNRSARTPWARFCFRAANRMGLPAGRARAQRLLCRLAYVLAEPRRWSQVWRGREDFEFPGSRALLSLPPDRPDVLHAHNLHAGYFDLRVLPWLSRQLPTVLTLHDMWPLTGHCAHSFECGRWESGCGSCPDLTIYPALRRDATAFNWRRKQAIFRDCPLYVAAPCRWLMDKVERSMLMPAVVEKRVIPNGVDLSVFHPGDKAEARRKLNLGERTKILLYSGSGLRDNPWRDFNTLRSSLSILGERLPGLDLLFLAVGDENREERAGRIPIRFVSFLENVSALADYYRAADVYIHPSKADTFPMAVLEALACGTPVVATRVGGIPEAVRSAREARADTATGLLCEPGDAPSLAESVREILTRADLAGTLSENAAQDARRRFDLGIQARTYLDWFREMASRGLSG